MSSLRKVLLFHPGQIWSGQIWSGLFWPGLLSAGLLLAACAQAQPADPEQPAVSDSGPKIKALLVTGQINQWHNPDLMDQAITAWLGETGLFELSVARTPAKGEDMSSFAPDFAAYDVVLLNYEGDDWPATTRAAFEAWMRAGGGLVSVHSTDNAFPNWPAFNEMIAVGGWGGRSELSGPAIRWGANGVELDTSPGTTFHPPPHDYPVTVRTDHPITRGLPPVWLHAEDELYSHLNGPAKNFELLATGFANPEVKDASGQHEPVLLAVRYGEGRVFHTTLGHIPTAATSLPASVRSVGFIATLQRGTEWAATGAVTQVVPQDFPGPTAVSLRP